MPREDPLDVLRNDPFVRAADPETRQWFLALLMYGRRSSSATHGEPPRPRRVPAKKKPSRAGPVGSA
jgi:hypothetical protein